MFQGPQSAYQPGALVSAAVSGENDVLGKFIKIDWKKAWSESISLTQDAAAAYKSRHPEPWTGSKMQIKQAAEFFITYLIEHGHRDVEGIDLVAESALNKTFDCDMFTLKLADFMLGIGAQAQDLKFAHIAPSKESYVGHDVLKVGEFYLEPLIIEEKGKKTRYDMLVSMEEEMDKLHLGRRVEIESWRPSERMNRSGILARLDWLRKDKKEEYDQARTGYKAGQDNSQVFEKMNNALKDFISLAYLGAQVADAFSKDEPENDEGFRRAGQNYLQMAEGYSLFSNSRSDVRNYAAEAVKRLERAIAVNPDNAGNYMLLGDAHALLGETDKARADYQKAVKLADPQDPSLKEIKTWLKKDKRK